MRLVLAIALSLMGAFACGFAALAFFLGGADPVPSVITFASGAGVAVIGARDIARLAA